MNVNVIGPAFGEDLGWTAAYTTLGAFANQMLGICNGEDGLGG